MLKKLRSKTVSMASSVILASALLAGPGAAVIVTELLAVHLAVGKASAADALSPAIVSVRQHRTSVSGDTTPPETHHAQRS